MVKTWTRRHSEWASVWLRWLLKTTIRILLNAKCKHNINHTKKGYGSMQSLHNSPNSTVFKHMDNDSHDSFFRNVRRDNNCSNFLFSILMPFYFSVHNKKSFRIFFATRWCFCENSTTPRTHTRDAADISGRLMRVQLVVGSIVCGKKNASDGTLEADSAAWAWVWGLEEVTSGKRQTRDFSTF